MDEQSQEIYEIKLRPPKETMNLTIPVDMHIDDLLGALGTMFQLLLCLKDNKPDVISHEYRCNDLINVLIRECELNTTQKKLLIICSALVLTTNTKTERTKEHSTQEQRLSQGIHGMTKRA